MNYANGVPKCLRAVLEFCGFNTKGMSTDKIREILGSHSDFQTEVARIEKFLTEEYRHICYFLPKYHCELNPIERVWAQAKRYSKAYCNYSRSKIHTCFQPSSFGYLNSVILTAFLFCRINLPLVQ